MRNNLYWSVYQNLEKELLLLADNIHIDDKQLDIYSMKIAELLIRVAVEVESIAKELYLTNGGDKADNNELFFDTDCLAYLNQKWLLSSKKVQVSSVRFFLEKEENCLLTPLKKAHKRGSSSEKWLQAYQAIKHNRRKSLEKANLKNLINAMAGLYLLNIYYKDNDFDVENSKGSDFNNSCGSLMFSIFLHKNTGVNINYIIKKEDDFNECTYIISPDENSVNEAILPLQELMKSINEEVRSEITPKLEKRITELAQIPGETLDDIKSYIKELYSALINEEYEEKAKNNAFILKKLFDKIKFKAVLNKNQF